QNKTKLAESQILEARELAKTSTEKSEVLKNLKLLVSLDSTRNKFQSAFQWQRQYFALKEELEQQNQPKMPINTDIIKEDSSENDTLNNDSHVNYEENTANEDELKKLKTISYILIAAFLIVSTILLLIYLKRKNTI